MFRFFQWLFGWDDADEVCDDSNPYKSTDLCANGEHDYIQNDLHWYLECSHCRKRIRTIT